MTLQEYIAAVYAQLPPVAPEEVEYVTAGIVGMYSRKWLVSEAVSMSRLTEHVNPELSEARALALMSKVSERVRNRKQTEALGPKGGSQ